jgi:cytochrome c
MNIRAIAPLVAAAIITGLYFASGLIVSADPVSKDEAVAMVQKAVAAIKSEGAEKAYAEISNLSGPFVKGDLYIAVVGFDGTLLAYGADTDEHVGDNVMDIKDSDGKEVVKERIELAKREQSFWQSYKFINPVTKKVEPKQMYCERLEEAIVCGGVYQ